MNKYTIDYGYGVAVFHCFATEADDVLREFRKCADHCFGIRKSIDNPKITDWQYDVDHPRTKDFGGTHYLGHGSDEVIFTSDHEYNGGYWKLLNEFGDECECVQIGFPHKDCPIHGESD